MNKMPLELTVKNQDLFYFSQPENTEYVGAHNGTLGLKPIVIMNPLNLNRWVKLGEIFSQRKYLIVDGHNRAYVDSGQGRESRAVLLTTDGDLQQVKPHLELDGERGIKHFLLTEPISTLLALDQFLLEAVYKELAWNESYPELLHTHFHYGVSV